MAKVQNLVEAIISDHREVESVFGEIEGSQDPQTRRELVDHAISLLVVHSVGEEQYLYPVAREVIPGGEQIVSHELEEHEEAEEAMKALEGMDATSAEFDQKVSTWMSDIRHHVADEEEDLLPRLRQHCSEEQLQELGEKFRRAKKVSPTRPHPSAPDTPPANKIIGPGVGLVDRVRDAINL